MSEERMSHVGPYEQQIGTFAPVVRYARGSRVPGWDDAADLDKDPAAVPDPATTPVPADLRAEIEAHMAKYPETRSAAVPALAAVQRHYGWCTPDGIDQAACVMGLTPAHLSALATFYDMLETEPVGDQTIYVCTNISCSLRGADALLARVREETDGDAAFNVRGFECLGACDIAPMASVNGAYLGPIELHEVPELIAALRDGREPLPDKALLKRPSADTV
jgi:NADH-quinone oxidoreductase subunit E